MHDGMTSADPRSVPSWRAVAVLVLASAMWSLNCPLIKLLYRDDAGLSGPTIAFYRSFLGGLALLPWA